MRHEYAQPDMTHLSGVYAIEVQRPGRDSLWYIGRTASKFCVRFCNHWKLARDGGNNRINSAMRKYGNARLHVLKVGGTAKDESDAIRSFRGKLLNSQQNRQSPTRLRSYRQHSDRMKSKNCDIEIAYSDGDRKRFASLSDAGDAFGVSKHSVFQILKKGFVPKTDRWRGVASVRRLSCA